MTDPLNTPPAPEYPTYPAAPLTPPVAQAPYGSGAPYGAGAPYAPGGGYPYAAPSTAFPGKTLGIVGFILAFLIPPVGLILGIVALVQSKRAARSNGLALAAVIIGACLFIFEVIALIAFVTFFGALYSEYATACATGGSGVVQILGQTVSCTELGQ